MIIPLKRSLAHRFVSTLLPLAFVSASLQADDLPATASIIGSVALPKEPASGIKIEGLKLADTIVKLEGKYDYPRKPYPKNWAEMSPADRRVWQNAFDNSEAAIEHQKKVEAAQAKRFILTTTLADDGSFSFEGIKPSWYQLTFQIVHPKARPTPSFASARAYGLRQFIVKSTEKPHNLGTTTLKLKNVIIPGDDAPDFTVTDYKGGSFKLSDFRGKYVLFDFWATWCGPCLAQIPNLEAISEKYDGENFVTLGLSVDQKSEMAAKFLEKKPSHYRQAYAGDKETYKAITTAYGFNSIPSIWLVDPEGKVVAKNMMGPAILKEVEKALSDSE